MQKRSWRLIEILIIDWGVAIVAVIVNAVVKHYHLRPNEYMETSSHVF